ncbi:hypothetical protein PQX77_021011 [Marasmius sp. AFHP31]|nr:hypothetical protein PQX77_021011 [Marasmius sp. AFHP31]
MVELRNKLHDPKGFDRNGDNGVRNFGGEGRGAVPTDDPVITTRDIRADVQQSSPTSPPNYDPYGLPLAIQAGLGLSERSLLPLSGGHRGSDPGPMDVFLSSTAAPALHLVSSFTGGKNNNNFFHGIQNIHKGRDMNLNTGSRTMVVNNYMSSAKDKDDEDDEDEDQPFSEKMLKIQIRAFNRQRSKINETELRKIDGQEYLDGWQRIIISDLFGKIISPADKTALLDAMIQLSRISGLAPKCLRIQDVGIQDLSPVSEWQSADVVLYKGKLRNADVAVKVLKEHPRPDDKKLETFLQQAVVWRKLEHQNILPFLGLYYFDHARSRVCLVSPWIENGFAQEEIDPEDYIKGIADGLAHLHNQKVVHGHLGASSILVDSDGVPRIGDLGLAQLLGKAVDRSEDVFRFGRLSYELFGGTLMKDKDGLRQPVGMSNAIWDMVKSCLSTSPSSRPKIDWCLNSARKYPSVGLKSREEGALKRKFASARSWATVTSRETAEPPLSESHRDRLALSILQDVPLVIIDSSSNTTSTTPISCPVAPTEA